MRNQLAIFKLPLLPQMALNYLKNDRGASAPLSNYTCIPLAPWWVQKWDTQSGNWTSKGQETRFGVLGKEGLGKVGGEQTPRQLWLWVTK